MERHQVMAVLREVRCVSLQVGPISKARGSCTHASIRAIPHVAAPNYPLLVRRYDCGFEFRDLRNNKLTSLRANIFIGLKSPHNV